jgi:hypothetical protein
MVRSRIHSKDGNKIFLEICQKLSSRRTAPWTVMHWKSAGGICQFSPMKMNEGVAKHFISSLQITQNILNGYTKLLAFMYEYITFNMQV